MQPIVISQNANLEYEPSEDPKILEPILENSVDLVFGSRFIGSKVDWVLFFWHSVSNRFLKLLSNMVTSLNLTEIET